MSARAVGLCVGFGAVVVGATLVPHAGMVGLALVSVALAGGLWGSFRRGRR